MKISASRRRTAIAEMMITMHRHRIIKKARANTRKSDATKNKILAAESRNKLSISQSSSPRPSPKAVNVSTTKTSEASPRSKARSLRKHALPLTRTK
jgi:Tfp pilus assembly protein PilE